MIFGLVQNIALAKCESNIHGKSERRAHKATKHEEIGRGALPEEPFGVQ